MKKTERTMDGIKRLETESLESRRFKSRTIAASPYSVIMSAWENADDTMLEQGYKSWHESQDTSDMWVNYFFLSLSCAIADCPNRQVIAWFDRRGIQG